MATKVLLRRWDGSAYEDIHPKTEVNQVDGLQTELDAKVDFDTRNQALGWLQLNSEGKINVSYLPDDAIAGMSFEGTLGTGDSWPDGEVLNTDVGNYYIFSENLSLTLPSDQFYKDEEGNRVEQDEFSSITVSFQAGDWLIAIVSSEESGAEFTGGWSVINNNQSDRYLSKSGGTLSGNLSMNSNDITNIATLGLANGNLTTDGSGINYGGNRLLSVADEGSLDAGTLGGSGKDTNYYRNASNINAGTIGNLYLPNQIDSNAATASAFDAATQFTFNGDVSGSLQDTLGGQTSHTVTLTVNDDSHEHNGTTVSYTGNANDYIVQGSTLNASLTNINNALTNKTRTDLGATEPAHDKREGDVWYYTGI